MSERIAALEQQLDAAVALLREIAAIKTAGNVPARMARTYLVQLDARNGKGGLCG